MTSIDPTARVEAGARIGQGVTIGPFCIVGGDVEIGDGCRLIANVHIAGHTCLGAGTEVHPFAVLGGPPQSVSYRGEPTRLIIGSGCIIREGVTINLGTVAGGGVTRIGNDCYLMAYSHVAHDCNVGNAVQFANGAALCGHCEVGDRVVLSGYVGVHQFVRIGRGVMVSGGAMISQDVLPFAICAGSPAGVIGVNSVGMRRSGIPAASILAVRSAFRELMSGRGALAERVARVEASATTDPTVAEMMAFIRAPRRRPIYLARRKQGASTDFEAADDEPQGAAG